MQKSGKAALVFIVDRSGSMCGIAKDMQGSIKSVLSDQKEKYEGDIDVTFVRFDTVYEEVFSARPIQDVSEDDLEINPRGGTALLDAMGQTFNTFERKFSEMDKKDRPEKVLFLIITDGGENASREYSRGRVVGMRETLERDHGWGFTYIGANQDAISEGSKIGVTRSKSLNYNADAIGVQDMSRSVSNFTSSYLCDGDASYSDDE